MSEKVKRQPKTGYRPSLWTRIAKTLRGKKVNRGIADNIFTALFLLIMGAFMALPLYPGALDGIAGVYRESPDFEIDEAAVKAFDSTFPPKAPADMAPIGVLLDRLALPARRAIEALKLPALSWLSRFSAREIRALEGVDDAAMEQINAVLREQ